MKERNKDRNNMKERKTEIQEAHFKLRFSKNGQKYFAELNAALSSPVT